MRKITKTKEPTTLTEYRASIPSTRRSDTNVFNDFRDKSRSDCNEGKRGNLRKQLLEEQGYICCYCMSRITCDNSKIEHFKSQKHYPEEQLNYQNLFVACNDSEGSEKENQHCDVRKGEKALEHIDLLVDVQGYIKYQKGAGKIYSENTVVDDEINTILNLNIKRLTDARKEAIAAFDTALKKNLGKKKHWTTAKLENEVKRYRKMNGAGKHKAYCEMFIYFLNKHIQRRTA